MRYRASTEFSRRAGNPLLSHRQSEEDPSFPPLLDLRGIVLDQECPTLEKSINFRLLQGALQAAANLILLSLL